MSSPVALKDCPKVDMDLKSQLEAFSPKNLKNASTEEKCVLPTAEGMFFIFIRQFTFLLGDKINYESFFEMLQ
jgi:Thymosin beta-4 family